MLEGLKYLFPAKQYNVMNGLEPLSVIVDKANDSDLFILGGGELISKNKLYLPYKGWEEAITVKKCIFGCGVNATELQPHVKHSIINFDMVEVRDYISLAILQEYIPQVEYFPDLSIPLQEKYKFEHDPVKGRAIVIPTERKHTRDDPGILEINSVGKTKEYLKRRLIEDEIKEVILVPFGKEDNNDLNSCLELGEYFKDDFYCNIVYWKFDKIKRILDLISSAEKVYSYRLHGCIFAYMMGVPFMPFPYHRKIRRVVNTLCPNLQF